MPSAFEKRHELAQIAANAKQRFLGAALDLLTRRKVFDQNGECDFHPFLFEKNLCSTAHRLSPFGARP